MLTKKKTEHSESLDDTEHDVTFWKSLIVICTASHSSGDASLRYTPLWTHTDSCGHHRHVAVVIILLSSPFGGCYIHVQ